MLAIVFGIYVYAEKQIDRANERRLISYQLANQLRQTSDDLTRMAREYVVTGNPLYKDFFQDILDIRDGKIPQPEGYTDIYWDLVSTNQKQIPVRSGHGIALLDQMRQAGFTDEEFNKLAIAKKNSDNLTNVEFQAMRLAEATGYDVAEARKKASLMLNDDKFHQAKAEIMMPISEFFTLMEKRTFSEVQFATYVANLIRLVFVGTAIGAILILWRTYASLRRTLGASIEIIQEHLRCIGQGELSIPIIINTEMENSILSGIAEMQEILYANEIVRKKLDETVKHFQAIVESSGDAIISKTMDGIIASWNHGAEIVFGYSAQEMIGQPMIKLIPADLIDEEKSILACISKGETVDHFETVRIHKSGRPINVSVMISPIRDEHGNIVGASKIARDITKQKQAEEEVRIAKEAATKSAFLGDQALELAKAGHWNIDFSETSEYYISSPRLVEIFGDPPRADMRYHIMNDWYVNLQAADKTLADATLANYLAALEGVVPRYDMTHPYKRPSDGRIVWVHVLGHVDRDRQGKPLHVYGVVMDVTQQVMFQAELERQAHIDYLTGVNTRGYFMQMAELELARAIRYENKLSVFMLDIDYFKRINDTHGHKSGDLVLKKLADICRKTLREVDLIGRIGGEEFAILLPETNLEEATEVARRLKTEIEATRVPLESGLPLNFTVSIGISSIMSQDDNLDVLLNLADKGLYEAKNSGRNEIGIAWL
ncbi:MAG: sensor domain-containing diguanylate cyclase [Methylobacter sp.]